MRVAKRLGLVLAATIFLGGGGVIWGQSAHETGIREAELPEGAQALQATINPDLLTENIVMNTCEKAFAIGEFLWACGETEEACRQFAYSLEKLALNRIVIESSPAARGRWYILCMKAALYRQQLDFFQVVEEDEDLALREIPPVERIGDEEKASDLNPQVEQFIQAGIRNGDYDIPITLNRQVCSFIGYFSDPKRKKSIEIGLNRLGRYRETFERIFKEEGIPQDLIFLGLVESNYSPNAYSRARAKGIWQFIEETGRTYGLRIDWWVDERCDFEKSTRSACRYLKNLYDMFGDWYLAMAAYNSGENRIQRILSSQPGKSYWEMCEDRNLPKETRNYVPAILASVIISKNPDQFGIAERKTPIVPYITVEIPSPTDLRVISSLLGIPEEVLRDLNPSLRRFVTPPDSETYLVNVPVGTPIVEFAKLWDMPDFQRVDTQVHTVADGETISSIARKYDVAVPTLRDFNRIKEQQFSLQPGMVIQIPLSPVYKQDFPRFRFGAAGHSDARRHKVKKGETYASIARKYGVSVAEIKKWNVQKGKSLRPGTVLSVGPAPTGTKSARGKSQKGKDVDSGTHQVKKGETTDAIARRYGITSKALLAANNLKTGASVKKGMRLTIPQPENAPPGKDVAETSNSKRKEAVAEQGEKGKGKGKGKSAKTKAGEGSASSKATPASKKTYVVRKGDSLYSIARKLNVDVGDMKKANRMKSDALKVGATLVVPQ